ncbi:SHOCT domain-containing protein [Nocardioides bruguierae]|uniref:SHOCT domain-containing protein n=1 Tax=Nocardioides bruguierae TaxID=2945102 RepID=UPI00202095BA|nr:PLDc N-terminal domain-containing protein [Nocardioides bruguierae]MCL8026418.1 PLDc N-terminal domain-containing protein [Nocardioides bruguierae]
MSFLDVLWAMFIAFGLVAYLMVMFSIITDLFRDRQTKGWVKAVWVVCLILFPLITSLVYLISRGSGMAERTVTASRAAQEEAETYIRSVAGTGGAADEIAQAHRLLESGAIDQSEFDALKARVLAA